MTNVSFRQPNRGFWHGKKVFLTGHTGFKGSWLSLLLLHLGCDVYGYSLPVSSSPSLFSQLELESKLNHFSGDILDYSLLKNVISDVEPDFLFHLAAQPLVRESYKTPGDTWAVNVIGSINVMESLRNLMSPCCAVMITTDKVYSNNEWLYSYRENDPLGGLDPYSSSKAACELAINSWRSSFLTSHGSPVHPIVSARSGNVVGGGDWAADRIVPDIVRSLSNQSVITVRNPNSTRPWQHVLEPLIGYILLAESLFSGSISSSSFNFGPYSEANRSVSDLVDEALKTWPGTWKALESPDMMHEANLLGLAIDLAHNELSWFPRWGFSHSIHRTINWYKQVIINHASPFDCCMNDIISYLSLS
tara:strand:- start:778 stop:1863 length:1086 start_codon:yes stop_codon:yes gene_type:complete